VSSPLTNFPTHTTSVNGAFTADAGNVTQSSHSRHESFRDAFADVPPSASRGFVEVLIPYLLARIS
jgi:hypothetical protein